MIKTQLKELKPDFLSLSGILLTLWCVTMAWTSGPWSQSEIFSSQVCKRDYECYRKLGDHWRHYHKLPFRQERLGLNGELSSHDLHPDKKNHMAATEDSVNKPTTRDVLIFIFIFINI